MNGDEYIDLQMTMARLKLSRRQVYRYAAENRIRVLPTKQGQLYHRGDVEQLAAALKVDERPERADVGMPRPPAPDRAGLAREIEELRELRAELGALIAEQREQRLLTSSRQTEAAEQDARLARAIAELEATRAALTPAPRPWWQRWGLALGALLLVALVAALAAVAVVYLLTP
jgi:hypothetical protein